jgi:hypothetical protein
MDNYFGKTVYTTVSVCGERKRVSPGLVVSDTGNGCCDVDIMSLHGGRPWIQTHDKASLDVVDPIELAKESHP